MDTTERAREYLNDIKATLATIGKMASDIYPALYAEEMGRPTLKQVYENLIRAEDLLAEITAENVERQENEDAQAFPFDAWDMIGKRKVTVYDWHIGGQRYLLGDNETALPSEITTVFPAWYARAQQALADAADAFGPEAQ